MFCLYILPSNEVINILRSRETLLFGFHLILLGKNKLIVKPKQEISMCTYRISYVSSAVPSAVRKIKLTA